MEEKKEKKKDGGGLYIAICCCILVIALIGYANNVSQKNKEEEEFLSEQAGENTVTPEITEQKIGTELLAEESEPLKSEEPLIKSETEDAAKNDTAEEALLFNPPVSGKVLAEFTDKQIYFEKIEEWRTHNGIDMECAVGDSVAAAMDGNVSKVFMGSLGYSIQIDHEDGVSTIYSNLDENPTVALGDSVNRGDVIGHVGQSAIGDMTDTPHLHFEVKVNGEYKNPLQYIRQD